MSTGRAAASAIQLSRTWKRWGDYSFRSIERGKYGHRLSCRKNHVSVNKIKEIPFVKAQSLEMVDAKAPEHSLGPDYRPEKPTATVSTEVPYDNVHILPQTPQLIALLT